MFQSGHLYGTANRIYYACFYAVLALLLTKNLSSSKHGGVISLFNRNFVKSGTVSREMGKFYSRMFDSRLESDYGEPTEIDSEQLEEDLSTAGEFIKLLGEIVARE